MFPEQPMKPPLSPRAVTRSHGPLSRTGRADPAVSGLESVAEVHTVTLQVWLLNTFFMSVSTSEENILALKLPTVLSHS